MNPTVQGAARSWTVWAGTAIAVLGFVQSQLPSLQAQIPEAAYGWINMAIGAVMIGLRFRTSESLADKAYTGDDNDQAG